MNRLFTFGCSGTFYPRYPTWVHAIADNFDYVENWGLPGIGNQAIFNSFMECHARNQINHNDTVMIMWSTFDRLDWYKKDSKSWGVFGSIFSEYSLDFYHQDWILENYNSRYFVIKDLAVMYGALEILKNLNCEYYTMSIWPNFNSIKYDQSISNDMSDIKDVYDVYAKVNNNLLPSVFDIVFQGDYCNRPEIPELDCRIDFHALPMEYIEYIQKVFPQRFSISDKTYKEFQNIQEKIIKHFKAKYTGVTPYPDNIWFEDQETKNYVNKLLPESRL